MIETLCRTISRFAPARLDAARERLLDRRQEPEQHERHDDRQQRQHRAQLLALQVAPDEGKEFQNFTRSRSRPRPPKKAGEFGIKVF
jgi:hypothetical protein